MASSPRRGDVFWVEFEPARGVEQAGPHPAVIIQNDVGNEYAPSTVVAAITSAALRKDYPFAVTLVAGDGGLSRSGYVNCSQLMTVDKSRLGPRIGSLSNATMERLAAALRYELSL